jgi:hypothetical protein
VNVPALAAPPAILKVLATSDDGQVTFQATVAGDPAAGIQEVWVTYTGTPCDANGLCTWQSLDLVQNEGDSTLWEGMLQLDGTPPADLRYVVQAVNGVGLVTMADNLGAYFVPDFDPAEPSAGADPVSPPAPTVLALQSPPTSDAYNDTASFGALVTSDGAPLAEQRVVFALGSQRLQATTDESGLASVEFPLLGSPGDYEVRVSLVGSADYQQCSTANPFTVQKQATQLSLPLAATAQYSDEALNAGGLLSVTLTQQDGRTLREMPVLFVVSGSNGAYAVSSRTNFVSTAPLGTVPLPEGEYSVAVHFGEEVALPDGVTLDLTAANYLSSSAEATLHVEPEDASVVYVGGYTVPEGSSTLRLAAQVTQQDDGMPGDITLAEVRYDVLTEDGGLVGSVVGAVASDGSSEALITRLDAGTYLVGAEVIGPYFSSSQMVAFDLPTDPVAVNTPISGIAYFTDSDSSYGHTAVWDWDDDGECNTASDSADCTLTEPSLSALGIVTGTHTYTTPGVYTVRLTITDADGHSHESTYEYVVVYDPSEGFVTGGGWIDSPEGAYTGDATLTGKASFGFVAKYKKGANVPTGETEFQFKVADLDFHSTSYQWLVVAGPKVQFKGEGTINGAGSYGFMISAVDADLTRSTDVDRFRIKISDKDTDVVYDNQMDADEDADPTTAIGGGSIVIHSK